MKKRLSLFLALALTATTLVGCGLFGSNDTSNQNEGNEATPPTTNETEMPASDARTVGVSTIEILDEYFDGVISTREASDRLQELNIDEIIREDGDEDVMYYLRNLHIDMSLSALLDDGDIERTTRNRNSLAELLDIPTR